MKQGIDALRGLRYKLRMMGILISDPLYIYGKNKSVVHNTSRPESVLRKKATQFAILQFGGHVPSEENVTYLMTKVLFEQKKK